jgi:CHAT domain-containing protein
MRLLITLLVALTACQCSRNSLDTEYLQSQSWFRAERYDLALPKVEEGLRRSMQGRDQKSEWLFRLMKAEMLINRRQVPGGLALLHPDPPDGAEWLEVKGRTLLLRGLGAYFQSDYSQAEKLFAASAEVARVAGSQALTAEVELRRALLLARQRKFAEAESALRGVIEAAMALHDPYLEARASGNLGFAMLSAARYDEALSSLEHAGALFQKLGANESVARAAGNAGACYLRMGDYPNARLRFEQAEAAASQAGNRFDQQVWIGNAANVASELGDYAAAARQYRRALGIAQGLSDQLWAERWMGNLADALIHLGDLSTAETVNNQALHLSRNLSLPGAEPYCLYNAARIAASRKQWKHAESLFRRTLQLTAEDPTILLDTHRELAVLYIRTAQPRQAEAEFRASIAEVERTSARLVNDEYRLSYLDSLVRFYGAYIDFLMSRREVLRALEVAESSRSKVLAQRSGPVQYTQSQTAALFQRLAGRAESVVLEYWIGERQSYLWIVTPQTVKHVLLPPAADLRAMVDSYQNAVLNRQSPLLAAAAAGKRLRDVLLSPALDEGCGKCRFLIVPDKFLYSLNFESLPAKSGDGYWIEEATVTVAPSLSFLAESGGPPNRSAKSSLLLIGDPAAVLPQYPKLDYAGREIDRIGGLLKTSTQRVSRGRDASPDAYKNAQPESFDYIHFTAHAEANPLRPLSSAVILSGTPQTCRLFARDVAAIPLRAELVAISACRSVGARTYSGEGPVGLAWAFLKAGARNVIAGLWDVNDRSTAVLMGGLYAHIADGSPVADALREAKLAMLRGGGS